MADPPSLERRAFEKEPPKGGIRCPKCGCRHLPVVYTRDAVMGRRERLRECRHCKKRFRTYEKAL